MSCRFSLPTLSEAAGAQLPYGVTQAQFCDPAYAGYRVSFGDAHGPDAGFYARGYKAGPVNFTVGDAFATLEIPFTDFSDDWDDATGDIIRTCAEDASLCPDDATLADMGELAVWAEGVNGDVHLEIDQIWAVGC